MTIPIQIIVSALVVFTGTLLIVPANIRFSRRYGFLAKPDERRIHLHTQPEAGGLSFGIIIVLAQLILGLLNLGTDPQFAQNFLSIGALGIVALTLGLFDDKYESRARFKILWQIALGLAMYTLGYRISQITNPLGDSFALGWMSLPVTVFWFVMIINAINFIDGIDGLAGGIAIISAAVLLTFGIREANHTVIGITSLLIAGNLAFLRYNFHPARIFMGDTGAIFIGLNLAAVSCAGTAQFKGITTMTIIIPITVMSIPVIDVILAVFRRLGTGRIFKPDKAHLHHMMLSVGLSHRSIALILYSVTFLFGLVATGFALSSHKLLFAILAGLMMASVIIAYILLHKENHR
ncbi:MAG: undecaprenyl/decaprenyl-phosphate alpha-N-acetylglucosaminyl 1-phosphate transferase [Candidatus Cloacimonetes bacterium]|nr:undecaprenyl/decaprenyl-phosphate alpha-N-acetylglucosaminyl 1-phosphate transferase [Candidatus Cloacimonadota bacterium]